MATTPAGTGAMEKAPGPATPPRLAGFGPSPAHAPPRTPDPKAPRFLDLFVPEAAEADVLLCGLPFDGAVIGRKGCKDGPTAIREAFRFLATHDPDHGVDLAGLRLHDLGDVQGMPPNDANAAHDVAEVALLHAMRLGKPAIVLGGDNSLSYPVVKAMTACNPGPAGLVVLDAHYDVRPYSGQPTSGTPYGRIVKELPGNPVAGPNVVEVGIRPFANTAFLAGIARDLGLRVLPIGAMRRQGLAKATSHALASATHRTQHVWLSVDIDALDQSIAPGCSAPGAGGLTFEEAASFVFAVASSPLCRGMDLIEVAPNLDPGGNTARTAAQLVATFCAGVAARGGGRGATR